MIAANLLTLPQIFNDNYFRIPDYQRGYAWEEDQVKDLLKDIDHLVCDGQALRHYTGTLVLSPQAVDALKYDIVDGQQRLTTLTILFSLLKDYLPAEKADEVIARYVWRGSIGNRKAVLELNKDVRSFHERVILGNSSMTNEPPLFQAHKNLLSAKETISKWLKEKHNQNGTDFVELLNVLEEEIGFLAYTPQMDAEIGIMFEVINNRGKALSELEKVKNYLVYCCAKLGADKLRENINLDWSDVLKYLNKANCTSSGDEGAFLRYCSAVHMSLGKNRSQYVYDEMKQWLVIEQALSSGWAKEETCNKIECFVEFLKTAALWYARLHGREHSGLDPSLISVLDRLRAQNQHASIMPLFLSLVIQLKGEGPELVRLLNLLEILNFRVYMAYGIAKRTDSGQGYLYDWAEQYYYRKLDQEDGLKVETQEQALEHFLVWFILENCPDNRFENSFKLEEGDNFDFYSWGGLRYFLMNYEAKLQPRKTIVIDKILKSRLDGKTDDYYSIEHLWAREHRNDEGENNRLVDMVERRRLGNFVLLELGININGSNKDIADKLQIYLGEIEGKPSTDLQHVREMASESRKIIKQMSGTRVTKNYYLDRHRDINDKQEKRYTNFAKGCWSVKPYLGYGHYMENIKSSEDA